MPAFVCVSICVWPHHGVLLRCHFLPPLDSAKIQMIQRGYPEYLFSVLAKEFLPGPGRLEYRLVFVQNSPRWLWGHLDYTSGMRGRAADVRELSLLGGCQVDLAENWRRKRSPRRQRSLHRA